MSETPAKNGPDWQRRLGGANPGPVSSRQHRRETAASQLGMPAPGDRAASRASRSARRGARSGPTHRRSGLPLLDADAVPSGGTLVGVRCSLVGTASDPALHREDGATRPARRHHPRDSSTERRPWDDPRFHPVSLDPAVTDTCRAVRRVVRGCVTRPERDLASAGHSRTDGAGASVRG
jgi:hypothetical protein